MGAGPVDEVIPQQDAHVYVTGAGEDPLWAGPPVDALDEGRRLAHIAEFAQLARRLLHLPRGNQEIEIDQGSQSAVPVSQIQQRDSLRDDDVDAGCTERFDEHPALAREMIVLVGGAVREREQLSPGLPGDVAIRAPASKVVIERRGDAVQGRVPDERAPLEPPLHELVDPIGLRVGQCGARANQEKLALLLAEARELCHRIAHGACRRYPSPVLARANVAPSVPATNPTLCASFRTKSTYASEIRPRPSGSLPRLDPAVFTTPQAPLPRSLHAPSSSLHPHSRYALYLRPMSARPRPPRICWVKRPPIVARCRWNTSAVRRYSSRRPAAKKRKLKSMSLQPTKFGSNRPI